MLAQQSKSENGVLAQLVERLNGIEEVRGSNPLGSTILWWSLRSEDSNLGSTTLRDSASMGEANLVEPAAWQDNPLGSNSLN